jgi:hypothetical protein
MKPVLFDWFFEASCNKHDEGYSEGGDELWRWYCDARFLLAMLKDIQRLPWYFKPFALVEAIAFYFLVILFGWSVFNYT